MLFRLLVLANLIVVLLAVVVVLVAALVFSLPWGMPQGGFEPKAKANVGEEETRPAFLH